MGFIMITSHEGIEGIEGSVTYPNKALKRPYGESIIHIILFKYKVMMKVEYSVSLTKCFGYYRV